MSFHLYAAGLDYPACSDYCHHANGLRQSLVSSQHPLSARNVAHSFRPHRDENNLFLLTDILYVAKLPLMPLIAVVHRAARMFPGHADSWTHRVHTRRFDRHVTPHLPLLKLSVKASSLTPPPKKRRATEGCFWGGWERTLTHHSSQT